VDLESDPLEAHDRSEDQADLFMSLNRSLKEIRQRHPLAESIDRDSYSTEDIERLKALGYL
jgi:hypothetical protein